MAWTNQQQMAIDARNCSVIVSAAAGSGKTAVLVERIVKLLTNEENLVRADRMVIATFTNDAAAELRQRLNMRLMQEIENNPDNSFLLKQYTLLQNAKISTINAFCFDILRDNIGEQGITPEFSVLDDTIDTLLKNEAIDETINKWCSEKAEETEFIFDRFCTQNDRNLVNLITEADKFLSSLPMQKLWLERTMKELDKPVEETVYYKILESENEQRMKKAIELAEENVSLIDLIFNDDTPKGLETAAKSLEQSEDDLRRAEKAYELLKANDTAEINEYFGYCTSGERLVAVGKKIDFDEALREKYKNNRSEIKSLTKECLTQICAVYDDIKEVREIFAILKEMLEDYYEILWEKKCERNAINFNDGERLALEFLAELDENENIVQSAAAKSLSEYYDIIMIDEYQDSNDKQDMIFKLLSKNYQTDENNNAVYGNNAFLVGDVKQSIYRFRLANPKNFISTLNNSVPFSFETHSDNTYIKLNKNFRSSAQVIDFVNFVFGNIMSEKCGEVCYDESEKLYFGASQYESEKENDELKTEIMFVADESDSDTFDDEIENREAFCVAKKIASMLEKKTDVIIGENRCRPCEPRDFCILVRKNSYTKAYINELKRLGVNAKGEEEKGYLASREVMILLDVLRIIDNPMQDIAISAVMMSPMFMFTAQEMLIIRSLDREKRIYLLLEEIADGIENEHITESLYNKCVAFYGFIKAFRLLSVTLSTEELIKKIYDTTDFVTVMQLYTDGEKKQANLRYLINYAHNYESSSSDTGGVSGFMRYIDRIIESGSDFQQGKISSTSDNYVSIKTMHKSKGLEFPFVFIAETTGEFKFDYPLLLTGTDNRIGFKVYNSETIRRYQTIPYTQLLQRSCMDVRSEEMRLFYVALTRAKQKLFISLKVSEKRLKKVNLLSERLSLCDGDIKKAGMKAMSMSEWLWLCVIKHKNINDIAKKIGYERNYDFDEKLTDDVFSYDFYSIDEIPQEATETTLPEPDENIVSELSQIWRQYYDTELSKTPAKLSVTQIAKKVENIEEFFASTLERPAFLKSEKALRGNERGTAIHTFLQYCDFDNAISDTEAEIWRLVDNSYLSECEAEAIPPEKIKAFFNSGLYQRMKKSDKVTREMKFMVALKELNFTEEVNKKFRNADGMIKGIMDLVFEENGELILVDYKSDRSRNEQLLIEKYELQLKLYKQALEIITSKKVREVYLYSVEMEKEILLNI